MNRPYCKQHGDWPRRGDIKCKVFVLLTCVIAVTTVTIGSSMAWLHTSCGDVKNIFTPSGVDCEVNENFNGSVKRNVNVTNTGDTSAYIRVKLITYRVNDRNQKIGGSAEVPAFMPGKDWILRDGFYYYRFPVDPGKQPASPLIDADGIALSEYPDVDSGKQVIEVAAEAIQAQGVNNTGVKAVVAAWGVDPESLG